MSRPSKRRVDVERLILLPILSLLLLGDVTRLWHSWVFDDSSGALSNVHGTLVLVFYGLMIGLLLTRRPSQSSGPSRKATVAAYGGTFAPFLLLLSGGHREAAQEQTAVAVGVTILGLLLSVYALGWLGRSFGVVPQARELVRSGPYRYVRHPLYVAELVTFLGAMLTGISIFSVAVLVCFVSLQAYRASQEEKVLKSVFPEYESYMAQAGRFTPRRQTLARAS